MKNNPPRRTVASITNLDILTRGLCETVDQVVAGFRVAGIGPQLRCVGCADADVDHEFHLRNFKTHRLHEILASTIQAEVEASRQLENIMFGSSPVYLFRTHPITASGSGKVS